MFQILLRKHWPGTDPEIFERRGPEAIIYKILERGGPKSIKMAFECSFQSFSYKSFANIPLKGGARAPWAPHLNLPVLAHASLKIALSRGRGEGGREGFNSTSFDIDPLLYFHFNSLKSS